MNWFVMALQNYAVFKGRAQRSEYWYFFLFYLLITFLLSIMDTLFGRFNQQLGMGLLSGVFMLALLVPSISVGVRRLHDTGRSGWWLLVGLVPFVGGLWLLYLAVLDSEAGTNAYGPNPKAGAEMMAL